MRRLTGFADCRFLFYNLFPVASIFTSLSFFYYRAKRLCAQSVVFCHQSGALTDEFRPLELEIWVILDKPTINRAYTYCNYLVLRYIINPIVYLDKFVLFGAAAARQRHDHCRTTARHRQTSARPRKNLSMTKVKPQQDLSKT